MKVRQPPLKAWLVLIAFFALYYWRADWAIPALALFTFLQVQFLREEVMALRRLAEPHIDPDSGRIIDQHGT